MSTAVTKREPRNVGAWFRQGPLGQLREEMQDLVARTFGDDIVTGSNFLYQGL